MFLSSFFLFLLYLWFSLLPLSSIQVSCKFQNEWIHIFQFLKISCFLYKYKHIQQIKTRWMCVNTKINKSDTTHITAPFTTNVLMLSYYNQSFQLNWQYKYIQPFVSAFLTSITSTWRHNSSYWSFLKRIHFKLMQVTYYMYMYMYYCRYQYYFPGCLMNRK